MEEEVICMKRIVIYGATAIAKLLTDSLKEGNEIVAYMVDRGYEHTFSEIVAGGAKLYND